MTDLGYWDIAQKESGTVNRPPPYRASDMGSLKLGYRDMGLLKLGYLGYWDPLLDSPISERTLAGAPANQLRLVLELELACA